MMKRESKRNAWEKAYTAIRDRILNMDLKPGQLVSEVILSKELGISRTPIREAFKKLEQEGLIINQNHRKRVYILTIRELEEIFDMKCAVEGYIAYLAALRKEPSQEVRLRAVMDRMEQFPIGNGSAAFTEGDHHQRIMAWLEIDEAFHDILYEMAKNRRAQEYIQSLNRQWHRLRMGINAMEGRIEKSIKEHLDLGKTILAGDAEGARVQMVHHLENLKRSIISIMSYFHYPSGEGR